MSLKSAGAGNKRHERERWGMSTCFSHVLVPFRCVCTKGFFSFRFPSSSFFFSISFHVLSFFFCPENVVGLIFTGVKLKQLFFLRSPFYFIVHRYIFSFLRVASLVLIALVRSLTPAIDKSHPRLAILALSFFFFYYWTSL